MQVLNAHVVVGSVVSVLHQRPERLDAVCVSNTIDVLLDAMLGGFSMIGFKDFSILAEIDRIESEPDGLSTSKESAMSFDAAYFVRKGFDLRARYDLFLPEDNSLLNEWKSVTAGVDVFPYFFLESTLNYRYHTVENMEDFSEVDVQLHFWF